MRPIAHCPACTALLAGAAEQPGTACDPARCGQCGSVPDAGLRPLTNLSIPMERAALPAYPPGTGASALPEAPSLPGVNFLRENQRREVWTLPWVRVALSLACLVLLAALLLQLVIGHKDRLAAQEPRLAPVLQLTCRLFGCEIQPLRRIESLLIEEASFSKTGREGYRLAFVFRNTGDAAIEVPALEVTLTDSQGQAVVRRVIMPAQFAAGAVTLAAHAELTGSLALNVIISNRQAPFESAPTRRLSVASYRILAFYP